jgi:trimeric autotransporter adhesin
MSTKTTFKRIALVAVAALGLGVLSVAPSQAAISGATISGTDASVTLRSGSTTLADSDTNTAAKITISSVATVASDTITVVVLAKSKPTGAAAATIGVTVADTASATSWVTKSAIPVAGTATAVLLNKNPSYSNANDSTTVGSSLTLFPTAAGILGATFAVALDTGTALTKGTYTFTAVATVYSNAGGTYTASTLSQDVSIVVGANTADSVISVPASATAYIAASGTPSADANVSAVSTADTTVDAVIYVTLKNASGNSTGVQDSITATVTGAGLVSFDASTYGKSVTYAATNGTATISVRGDGTAGTSSIAVTTSSGASWTKSLTFYAKAAKTITAAVNYPVLAVGANTGAVAVSAVDASGSNWTGSAYIVASSAADALVAGSATTPVACAAWNSTDGILCPVTAIAAGTAKFKVIDASTVAAATATSNEVTLTVSAATPATVKLAFDKATYAPFEKAIITVTPLDKDGKTLPGALRTNLLATGGISTNIAFGSLSDTLTATQVNSASANGTGVTAGAQSYVVYMPAQGDVKITATGGTALPLAGQVAISATASVVNTSVDAATDAANEATDAANAATDAALAAADAADAATAAAQDASDAVAALSATVAKLVASLKAQITSLTNLVIKIQKKVRA